MFSILMLSQTKKMYGMHTIGLKTSIKAGARCPNGRIKIIGISVTEWIHKQQKANTTT